MCEYAHKALVATMHEMVTKRTEPNQTTHSRLPSSTLPACASGQCGHANKYGATTISGHARIHMGNTYVYNYHHHEEHSGKDVDLPLYSDHAAYRGRHAIVRTCTLRTQYWLLFWLVTLTHEMMVSTTTAGSERSCFLFLELFGRYVLYFGIYARVSRDLSLRVLGPRLRNIVSDKSPFMLACQRGDFLALRHCLSTRSGSWQDVTKDNFSPLYFAIDGGHEHVVQALLDLGAAVDDKFGENQTSPLS